MTIQCLKSPAMALAVIMFLSFGCTAETPRPKLAKVSGQVNFKGEAVEGATVTFITPGSPRFATGVTDASGIFDLTTFEKGDGAMLGDCVVTVTKFEPGSGPKNAEELAKGVKIVPPKLLLPAKYGDAKTSPLKETVTAGVNNALIELEE